MTPATLSDDQALELLLKPPAAPRETPDIDGFLSDNQALDLLLEGPGKVEEDKDVSPISTAVRSFGAGAAGVVGSIPKSVGIAAHQIDRALGRGPEGEGWPQEEYTTYRVGKAIEGLVSPPEPDEGGFLSKTLPGGAGSMVAFVAGGVAGKAAKLPALAITAALGSSATGAILYEEALAKGSSEDEALGAWIAGSTLGLTEAVPITRALGRADKATGGGLKRLLASGFKGGSEEALQELIQGAGSDKIRVEILGEDAPDNVLGYFTDKDTVEGSGAGFILGTGLSMAASAIGGRAARSSRTRTPPPEVAPEPESAPEAGPTPEVVAEPAPVPTPEAVAPEPVNLSDQEAIDLLLGEEAAPEAIPEGTPAPELPPVEGPVGKETVLHSPAGELRARYRLTEAGTLQPSHNPTTFEKNPNYPAGVQERAYHDNKNAQAEVINVSQNFKEELVINTDPTAINGPPQATSTGVVVGGNQRDMATQRMYLDGKGDNYRKYLEEHAEEYGLTKEQVRSLKNPELFREILDAPTDTEGLRVLGRDLNRSFTKALSEMEEAVSAGKNLSVETANSIGERLEQMGDKATLRSMMTKDPMVFRDAMLRDGVMRESDLPKYFTNEGALNSVGKDFVENAMVGSAVRDVDLLQSLPKNLVAKFERVVPQMLELGKRSDTWNIMEDVREAARQVSSAQIRGIKLEDQLQNKTMFGEGPTAKVQAIARALAKKPTEVAAIFKNFSKEARSDVENQVTMFGAADPIEAFDRIFGADSTAVPKSSEAAMRPGEGAYAHAGGRPILPSLKKLFQKEMPKDLVRRSEILEKLSKELGGIPIRLGRISTKKALGIYKVKPEVIRLRQANDISVAMHEAGHHINKLMFPGEGGKLNWGPLEKFEAELDAIATPSKKGDSSLPEGFAEFIRLYVTSPGEAIDKAPRFYRAFESKLAEMPELRDVLIGTRKEVRRYIEQPAAAKVLSHISTEAEARPKISWDKFYTGFFDGLHPVKKVTDALAKLQGKELTTEKNAYLLSRLFAGWVGKANHFLEIGTFDPSKLATKDKDLSKITADITGKPLKDILRPFEGEFNDLRIFLVASRVLELSGLDQEGMHEKTIKEGLTALQKLRKVKETGIDIKDAKDAIKEVETPEIKTAAKDLYKVQDEGLLYLVRSGFMDAETADVIRDMNRRYVPFYRVMEESTAGKGGGGKTMADLPSPVKGMKGSTREIIDPLESIVKNIYTFINLAERNKVALTLADQADTTEGAGRWVEKVPAKMAPTQFTLEEIQSTLKDAGVEVAKIDKKKLEAVATIFRPMPAGSQRENVISVFRNGKRDLYQVQPDLYKAMQGMDEEVSNIVIRILSKPAKAVRLGFTQANPEFALVNIARDVMLATVQSRNGFTPLDMFRGLSEVVKKSDLFNEFVRSGGMQSAMLSLDRTHLQKNLEDMMASKGKMLVKHPIEALRILGEYSELSTRMGEYRKARKKGKSAATSAFDAREITVDFARIGSSVRALNMIIPFFNATNQSADRLVRAFKEDPTGFSVRAAVGIAIPSLMLYAVNRDNEDYWELPSWKRDFFWMIPTKGTPLEKETPFIGINKPFQLGLMYGSALERGLRWLDTKDPTAFDGLLNSLAQTTIPSPIPAAAMGPLEAWANKSFFTGRDLVPGFMQNLPPQHQFNPWTTDFAKSMSRFAGRVGVPVSPIKLEHSLFSYTGGAGRSAVSIIDPLFRSEATERPTRTLADIPIARRFAVRTAGSTESMQRFYDRLADLDQKRTAEKYAEKYRGSIKPEKMTAKEHREYDLLNSERRRMSGISTRIRKIEFSKKSAEEKRELIDKLSLQRRKIASSTMKRSRRLRK